MSHTQAYAWDARADGAASPAWRCGRACEHAPSSSASSIASCTRCRRPPVLPVAGDAGLLRAPRQDRALHAACRSASSPRSAPASTWCGSTAIVMPDQTLVAVTPPPTLRCSMAEAVAEWVRDDVGPAGGRTRRAARRDRRLRFYECRRRNNVRRRQAVRARQGQRARRRRGQASQRRDVQPDRSAGLASRSASGCASRPAPASPRCSGPGSDGYHNEHIHLDLAERSRGYRICQWNVLDPRADRGEVPLPRPRPMDLAADQTRSR